jgi:thiamine pyrophosphate-dependent acetolactate synthase large subunit-like protein
MRGMGSFQELDAIPIFSSITKWSALVESTARIPDMLEEAFQVAVSGRPGPVYLDFPEDVLTGLARSYATPSLKRLPSPSPDDSAIARAADLLHHAARPGMIIGKGARWSEAFRELTRLADDFGIPFITSPMGRGLISDDHPGCSNPARGVLQAKADVILVAGARLDWTFRFGAEIAPDAKVIQIDIHEPEVGVNITPTVGIVGDLKDVLTRLLDHLALKHGTKETGSPWHTLLEDAKQSKLREWSGRMNEDSIPMSPYRMLKEVREFLPRDAVCILDGNIFMAAAQQVLPAYTPVTRFTAGTNGCMGVGIPFGVGAKLAEPTRPVVVLCGDTAFGFSAMEMETAVRHQIPIIVVVVNNDGNAGALHQKAFYPPGHERVTMFQPDIRYEQIMRAFGGHAEFVDRAEDLNSALERAANSGIAACINVKVDPHAPYPRD